MKKGSFGKMACMAVIFLIFLYGCSSKTKSTGITDTGNTDITKTDTEGLKTSETEKCVTSKNTKDEASPVPKKEQTIKIGADKSSGDNKAKEEDDDSTKKSPLKFEGKEEIYTVSKELVDKKATDRTKSLMKFLTDTYGEYIISGQYCELGIYGAEFNKIKKDTGKYPAILGLDLIDYTPSRVANGTSGKSVTYAVEFDKKGGIVTFCWHWNAPEPYLYNSKSQPWWSGFYEKATSIDLKKIMDGEDKDGYDLLLRDIDAIAKQLIKLQEADIPILWRPLHEASGGWFWWGASGSEAYIKLYRLLFDRLTNYHNIHNLIWVWNGQDKNWYPGDEYVDIVSTDIYPGEHVYTSQAAAFRELLDWTADNRKIIALSENGCLFDPDLTYRDNAKWAFFSTWGSEFALTQKYTGEDMVYKVYNHEKVITLDELPDLKNYDK